MIWLSETKTCLNVSVPGFRVYYNPSKHGTHRGGIILLMKDSLVDYIKCIDMDTEGQIWVVLAFIVNYKLGGVYINPDDSPYFQQSDLGALASHTIDISNTIVMGDINARVAVPNLVNSVNVPYIYSGVVDRRDNARGRSLLNMCANNNMVIGNHLLYNGRQLGGNLSFRSGDTWKTELDICLIKEDVIDQVTQLDIHQDIPGSDHAPLSVTIAIPTATATNIDMLLKRSQMLGQTHINTIDRQKLMQTPSYRNIDLEQLTRTLQNIEPPIVDNPEILPEVIETGFTTILDTAHTCRNTTPISSWDQSKPRWARILESKDPKTIWKSVNWRGTFDNATETQPSDNAFKNHFERLLSQNDHINENYVNTEDAPYVPFLDNTFDYSELENAVKSLDPNKSFSGICPGILKSLPLSWILFLLTVFNLVFTQTCYPLKWCFNKLFVLFKSGDKMSCDNYCGISIMDTLAKIYDILVLNRLLLWFNVDKCQAGAQKGRSCLEQIFTLRMLCNLAVNKKKKLYVLFIDYSKAYDRVPRHKLIEVLKSQGCGKVMLNAIQAIYKNTKNILKTAIINSTIGVHQGLHQVVFFL